MPNILITNLGSQFDCLVSTSIIEGLFSKYSYTTNITYVVRGNCKDIFRWNRRVKEVLDVQEFNEKYNEKSFDIFINLHPDFSSEINAKEKYGFGYSSQSEEFKEILYESRKSSKNIFQIYYNLSNLTWRGQGYSIGYRPKTRSKEVRTGISISNINLKHYVIDKLELEESKIWTVPFRHDFCKKIDEVNKCGQIITDDLFIMSIASSLRKHVFFLKTFPLNYKVELFGRGFIFPVPINISLNI